MQSQTGAWVITFRFGRSNHLRASDIALQLPTGSRFTLHAGEEARSVHIRLVGKHMVYPILAGAKSDRKLNYDPLSKKEASEAFQTFSMKQIANLLRYSRTQYCKHMRAR
jgi:UDP-N-acetylmuramyl pentapeptide synthase